MMERLAVPDDDPKACGGAYRSSPTTRMPRRAASARGRTACNAQTQNDYVEHEAKYRS